MERLIERVCGLDVHKQTVAACVRVPGSKGPREQHVRTFGTTAAELLALRDWLEAHGVTHIAMESMGVYWKAIYYVLEERFTCLLVNAAHVKQVPGRKTDVQDCVWIAQLLEHGLLRGEFRATGTDSRAARSDAIPQGTHPGSDARGQPSAQAAGGCWDPTGVRRHGHLRCLGSSYAGGAGPRHDRSRCAGGAGAREAALQVACVAPSVGRAVLAAPRVPRQPTLGAPGLRGRDDRHLERAHRGGHRPFR